MRNVFVAGGSGMVGSAICRRLAMEGDCLIMAPARHELDLTDRAAVRNFFATRSIDEVYLAAARVGGIYANNTYPVEFLADNLDIQNNIILCAREVGVPKLLFLGSSCIYPKLAEQPIREESLLTGALEPTNEAYALAKIAGLKLCESMNRQYGTDYRSVMPTNLYGPGDNYHPENSHVIPGLIRRFHDAVRLGHDRIEVWGTGSVHREFLHVDDLADACHVVMSVSCQDYQGITSERVNHINVGFGTDVTIRDLAQLIAETVGFKGEIIYDSSKPDGTPKKLLNSSKLRALGWKPQIGLSKGLESTYFRFKRDNV
jgi:GDP-L-fucose synthase